MARETKAGISYFSHDTDMLQDRKIRIIKAKHKLIGYAVFLRLLEELYRDKGYYLLADEEFNILFADDNNLDLNVYILILNDCIKGGLFDSELYKKYSILTSKRIQTNYIEATERRKNIYIYKEYLLLNVDNEWQNVNIQALNADICTQSKVEQIKTNKNKEEKNNCPYINIRKLFVESCKSLPSIRGITEKRKPKVKKFWEYMEKDEEQIKSYFGKVEQNDHLNFKDYEFRKMDQWKDWKADFDYIIKPETVDKVEAGNIIISINPELDTRKKEPVSMIPDNFHITQEMINQMNERDMK